MMFHRPCQVIFGTVRAIIELIFLCRKKLMKRGGVCEIKLSLSSLMSPSKLPNTTPYCGQTEARLETQAEEKLRDPGSLSNNGICRRKNNPCNKKIKIILLLIQLSRDWVNHSLMNEEAAKT